MRFMSEALWDVWESGEFVGDDKPYARVTIQKAVLKKFGPFRSLVFAQEEPQYELPNVKTITIDSRHQSDAATMTLTFLNQIEPDVMADLSQSHSGEGGPSILSLKDLAQPGYYTFRRGITPESESRWGHGSDPLWVDMFIPNRVVRTFQGYGTDGAAQPWDDTKLILTGTWLIDKVDYTADGIVTVQCRDAAKLLIEQRLYPPIIPVDQYPLEFCADYTDTREETYTETTTIEHEGLQGGNVAKILLCSAGYISGNTPWYGCNNPVYGHRESHAFDGNTSSYWLSVGNNGPNELWSFEWIGGRTFGEPVNKVRIKPKWGGYKYFIAVMENGKWVDGPIVPYGYWTSPAYPNGSNKPYVKSGWVPKSEAWFEIELPRVYNADQVRIIFTNLQNSGLGSYPYRAALYEFQVLADIPPRTEIIKKEITRDVEFLVPGNISDYTDIVKVLAAWSGFYWPWGDPTDQLLENWLTEEDLLTFEQVAAGLTNKIGRVWGDFAYSGAFPVDPPCIPASFWDNKSVMDGINQIKEILGFICYVDATGGLVWRMPNIWRTGNFITGFGFIGADSVREVDEKKVLIDYGVSIDDANLRSEIHVVSADDPTLHTSIQPGWAEGEVVPSAVDPSGDLALLGGQDRIMLVPNYPFISQGEVDKFAYLVSLWIHWSYRKGKVRIPGNPAFEPDDQVRVYERITEESYIHYLQGVRSSMDLDKGTWYLDLETHWLGNGPDQTWVVNTYKDMPAALYAYLRAIGEITEDGDPDDLPPDFDPNFDIPDFPDEVPRLDTDLDQLFPNPPVVEYPYDDSWSDQDIADAVGSGWASPSTPTGGGSVNHRSEAWKYTYWGARGSDLTTITFMYKWQSVYAFLPPAEVPNNTHPNQASTVRTTVPRAAVPFYLKMAGIFANHNYNVFSCAGFAGTDRKIAGTNTYSAHAWGLAIDINPRFDGTFNDCCNTSWNSWIARPQSATFYNAAKQIVNIKTKAGVRAFGWGGFWKTKRDYMHFEVLASKAECFKGVA